MIYFILAFLVLFLIYEKHTSSHEVEGSKFFYLSDGASKEVYLKMRTDGMSREGLMKFTHMEDRFLKLEKLSVCTGIPYIVQATLISNKIKETFPKYNFSYHTTHLKQIAEPGKTINTKIKC